MRYLKMFGLAAVAAVLLAFAGAGSATATELDCGASTMCEAPTKVHLVGDGLITFDSATTLACEESTIEASLSTGASGETPNGAVTALTFTKCGGWTFIAIPNHTGTLEIHTKTASADGNGTLTWTGAEWTTEGFGLHCIYGTGPGHDIGTLTGSQNTGGTATFDIEAEITRVGGRSGAFCGGSTAKWTGFYKVTSPMYLDVT